MDNRGWELKFGIEVSARYHDWRRATMLTYLRSVRAVTFIAAVITLATAFNPFGIGMSAVSWIVGCLAVLVACVNLLELVANFDDAARKHEDLYKRFKQLQARVASDAEENVAAWESEAQTIRIDEPPTMWAIYARCWNQTIDRHGAEREGYYRTVGSWQSVFGYLWHYRPSDFPPGPVRTA